MARKTEINKDYIVLDETNIEIEKAKHPEKVHLIELRFKEPTEEILKKVLNLFPETRRFVVSDFIRFYNHNFKRWRDKKYYVQNLKGANLIIFTKRNNKILLDLTVLRDIERQLIYEDFRMILEYVEVIKISREDYEEYFREIKMWKGNVIIMDNVVHGGK